MILGEDTEEPACCLAAGLTLRGILHQHGFSSKSLENNF
jgi:hypothetical protein